MTTLAVAARAPYMALDGGLSMRTVASIGLFLAGAVCSSAVFAEPAPDPGAAPAPTVAPAPATGPPQAAFPAPAPAPAETAAAPVAAPPPPVTYAPQPAYQPRYATEPPRRRRKVGLMIAGLATLGGSYALSALVGLQLMSGASTEQGGICTNCDEVGSALLIPIAGPWIALPKADGDDGKVVTVVLGVAQATGLVLSIAGISAFVSSGGPDTAAHREPDLQVHMVAGGALASVRTAL